MFSTDKKGCKTNNILRTFHLVSERFLPKHQNNSKFILSAYFVEIYSTTFFEIADAIHWSIMLYALLCSCLKPVDNKHDFMSASSIKEFKEEIIQSLIETSDVEHQTYQAHTWAHLNLMRWTTLRIQSLILILVENWLNLKPNERNRCSKNSQWQLSVFCILPSTIWNNDRNPNWFMTFFPFSLCSWEIM